MANRIKFEVGDSSNFRFEEIDKQTKNGDLIHVMVIRLFVFGIIINLEFTDYSKLEKFGSIVNIASKKFKSSCNTTPVTMEDEFIKSLGE